MKLLYSTHARARMAQRNISKGEVARAVKKFDHCLPEDDVYTVIRGGIGAVVSRPTFPGGPSTVITTYRN
jgi:hypothetical protein